MNVAVIGVGGRGRSLAGSFLAVPNASIEYLVDVDSNALPGSPAISSVRKPESAPETVQDMRRVFDDKSIDAVVIATPDHWHAPAAMLACERAKDVYLEKPCSHNLREGRLLVETVRATKSEPRAGTGRRVAAVS